MEPAIQEEPLSSTAGTGIANSSSANGSLGSIANYDSESKAADLMPSNLWNSVTGKLSHKSGSVNTPDGESIVLKINRNLRLTKFKPKNENIQ